MIDQLEAFSYVPLAHLPTPLEPLAGLSRRFAGGPSLMIKRDDCTGLASGGNKTRKLEYVLAEAVAAGADTIITTGGLQSNHARQTAAACAKLGLTCILALRRVGASATPKGNLLLDEILGASVRIIDENVDVVAAMETIATEVAAGGGRPYIVPLGASTPLGALGYARCAAEIMSQLAAHHKRPTHVVVAGGSGGTQAGLLAGFEALGASDVRVIGVDIDANAPRTRQRVESLLAGTRPLLGLEGAAKGELVVLDGFAGEAYGVPTVAGNQAILDLAHSDGILLDPVYTGKAMAALLSMLEKGEFCATDCVAFVHTGGLPILFAIEHHQLGTGAL